MTGRQLAEGLASTERFVLSQQSYMAIAVSIYAGSWAASVRGSLGAVLFCTLPLRNLIALVQDHLGFLYNRKGVLRPTIRR